MLDVRFGEGLPKERATVEALSHIREHFATQIREVDQAIVACLNGCHEPASHYGMIRYHLGFANESLEALQGDPLPRGKRLRAIMALLICRSVGVPAAAAEALMLASEMIHNASLVHDDIQDGDTTRWGRPTVWALFGCAQAINVGDHLLGMAYQLLLHLRDSGVHPEVVLCALEIYNQAYLRMCEGQHLDLKYQGRVDIEIEQYLDMIGRKTAAAFESVSHAAARLATCDANTVTCYRRFGTALGMMYQICDDMRAIWAEPTEIGRESGRDVLLRKVTLPLLYAVKHGSQELGVWLQAQVRNAKGLSEHKMGRLRDELVALGVDELCRRDVAHYRDQALTALQATQVVSPEQNILEAMVNLSAETVGVYLERQSHESQCSHDLGQRDDNLI
ncbi:MAG: polyprenyl synthetase family protein [Candidatus Tectomicrobia bacterium]